MKTTCKNSGGYPYNIMSKDDNECAEKKVEIFVKEFAGKKV